MLVGLAVAAVVVVLWACGSLDLEAPTPFRSAPASERYLSSLDDAGLLTTPMAQSWSRAAAAALREPTSVDPPYREVLYFAPERPTAVGLRVPLRVGQELRVTLEGDSTSGRAFLDLFGPVSSPGGPGAPGGDADFVTEAVANSDTAGGALLEHVVERDGEYILRLQPELLGGGQWTLALEAGGRLTFPVEGRDARAIGSGWGAPRDGGRRSHRGVDIFADRGTPAVSAVDGRVSRVGTNRLGGNVVWVQGEGLSLYYAHLDRQLVRVGERVAAGDPVGLVGNTGNAAATPPHLHFGVHRSGTAIDPAPYLASRASAPPVTASFEPLGRYARVAGNRVNFRTQPTTRSQVITSLERHTALRVLGATRDWYRVALPDGRSGFLFAGLAELAEQPIRRQRLDTDRVLLAEPAAAATAVGVAPAGTEARILARFDDYAYIRADGIAGGPPARGSGEGWTRL